jgi:signal transduction histidine kinase
MLLSYNGILDFWLKNSWIGAWSKLGDFFAFLALISYGMLITDFLDLKKSQPRIYRAFLVNQALLAVNLVWFYLGSSPYAGDLSDVLSLTTVILALLATARASRQKFVPAYFFLAGVTCMTVSIFAYEFVAYRIVMVTSAVSSYSVDFISLGVVAELVLMSIGILYYLKQKEHEQQKAASERDQEMARADGMQSVLQHLVHDLANPISVVMGVAEMELKRSDNDPLLKERWSMVLRAGKQNYAMLSNVDTKIGMMKTSFEILNLKDIIDEVTFTFKHLLEAKGITLVTENDDDDIRVFTDKTVLTHQVLCNILSNSIKFSFPNSAIRICVKTIGKNLRVLIEDQGIGIPDAILTQLRTTKQVDSSAGTQGEKGTGRGMGIAKTAMESLGGTISIESRHQADHPSNHGTKITIQMSLTGNGVKDAAKIEDSY